jgi:clan AA aspartic protease (TIGR02281 family)
MKKTIIAMIAAIALPLSMVAQSDQKEESYYMKRGKEKYSEYNYQEAEELFQKEVENNPTNCEAYYFMAYMNYVNQNNGKALENLEKGIKASGKDKKGVAMCYILRSEIERVMGKESERKADLDRAIKTAPDMVNAYFVRGDYYLEKREYDKAMGDYEKAIEVKPTSAKAHQSKAMIHKLKGENEEAVKELGYAITLNPNDYKLLEMRSECLRKAGRLAEAMDDAILYISEDQNFQRGMDLIKAIADTSYWLADVKLRAVQKTEPSNSYWYAVEAKMQYSMNRYRESIASYERCVELDENPWMHYREIGDNYRKLGDMEMAIEYLSKAVAGDSTDYRSRVCRYLAFDALGRKEEAMADLNKCIQMYGGYAVCYFNRAWFEQYNGMETEALTDLTAAIDMAPSSQLYRLIRGDVFMRTGNEEMAKLDFRKVIDLHETSKAFGGKPESSAMYAYYRLGEVDKAMEILRELESEGGEEYDVACIYSMLGNTEKAMKNLRASLEGGYREFHHIMRDYDLENVRKLPEFKQMMEEYMMKPMEDAKGKEGSDETGEVKIVEIPFVRDGGNLANVKCEVNGLPLHFIFDTGASSVTISTVEATFMLKNGYLKDSDISGKQYFTTADGSISEGTNIILRSINCGGLTLENVRASVVASQRAPLLLGQTVMQRLGRIEIDNDSKVLRVHYRGTASGKK